MNAKPSPDPADEAMLTDLAAIGMRAAQVVARVMEIEQQAVEGVATFMPPKGCNPDSLSDAIQGGQHFDGINAALADSVPRIEILVRALDRAARLVRRSIALKKRLQAGWPRAGSADTRQAMVRRQVARGVSEVIANQSDGETAERLYDDLAEHLDDPDLAGDMADVPVEETVRRLCRDLGLVTQSLIDGVAERQPEAASLHAPGGRPTHRKAAAPHRQPRNPAQAGPTDTC